MKATGIVRKLDHLGRVVIPVEIRRTLDIATGDPVEIVPARDGVYIRRYNKVGDINQLMDTVERMIRDRDYWLEDDQLDALLGHVRQMRRIVED